MVAGARSGQRAGAVDERDDAARVGDVDARGARELVGEHGLEGTEGHGGGGR